VRCCVSVSGLRHSYRRQHNPAEPALRSVCQFAGHVAVASAQLQSTLASIIGALERLKGLKPPSTEFKPMDMRILTVRDIPVELLQSLHMHIHRRRPQWQLTG